MKNIVYIIIKHYWYSCSSHILVILSGIFSDFFTAKQLLYKIFNIILTIFVLTY